MSKTNVLPDNLRLNLLGQVYCADGSDLTTYLLASPLGQELIEEPVIPVVLIRRSDFERIINELNSWRRVGPHLIEAA